MADSLQGINFYIRTFGCQMNENDSERIAGVLVAAGAQKADSPETSDVVIVNTCAVREKSEEKLFSYLGRLAPLRRRNNSILAVAGCMAQIYRSELLRRKPVVDFVIGPHNYHKLPQMILEHSGGKRSETGWSREWIEIPSALTLHEGGVSAYVTIMEGCNRFCSYCIVPFGRGREKSRPLRMIIEEVDSLAGRGYKEIQLLGQNVNAYRDPETGASFPALLRELGRMHGIEWIRFITSHPRDLDAATAEAMAADSKICRQIHLPLQSGSSAVLERMNRGYTREDYLRKVSLLRRFMPEIALSTDIIVGFPGETDEDYRETLRILQQVEFANLFSFRYSPRPHTAALKLKDDVPLDLKKERLVNLQALQKSIQEAHNRKSVGQTMKVLCLGPSPRGKGMYCGRNEAFQVVNFPAPEGLIGRFVSVTVIDCGPYSLHGEYRGVIPS
jgi:tRNA-2-methylthio-N6-dimethylallyladenosine synthase